MTTKFNKWDLLLKAERPVQVPHPADFLSTDMYKRIQETVNNVMNYNYSCILEAEGSNSELALNFCADSEQEAVMDEFLTDCNSAILRVCTEFIERGEKEL